jgi:acyl dehydratase
MEGRFLSPVYPGETVRAKTWIDGNAVTFRSTVPARGETVPNAGLENII